MQNDPFDIYFQSILKLIMLYSYRLQFFRHGLRGDCFLRTGFVFGSDLVYIHSIFLRPLEGKNRSATAPLAFIFCSKVTDFLFDFFDPNLKKIDSLKQIPKSSE